MARVCQLAGAQERATFTWHSPLNCRIGGVGGIDCRTCRTPSETRRSREEMREAQRRLRQRVSEGRQQCGIIKESYHILVCPFESETTVL